MNSFQDERYFRKTSSRKNVSANYYSSTAFNESAEPIEQPANQDVEKVNTKKHGRTHFSTLEKISIVGMGLIVLFSIAFNLFIQYQNTQAEAMVNQYVTATDELKLDSDLLRNEILERYNYDAVQGAAEENGMTIEKSRIKEVNE